MTSTPAGWYPDPAGGTGTRWWDGTAWTEHLHPAPQQTAAVHSPAATMSPATNGQVPASAPAASAPAASAPPASAPPATHDVQGGQPAVVNVHVGAAVSTAVTGSVTLGTGETRLLASPGRRFGARVIDYLVVIFAQIVLGVLGLGILGNFTSSGGGIIATMFGLAVTLAVLGIAYEATMIALRGQTVGKMAVGIKVIRGDDGGVPGWGKAIMRWIIPFFFIFIPVFGWLLHALVFASLTWDTHRQGWHDKAASTVVVNA
jgi:uncharacterized RDD family membrane protein YckC